MVSKQEIESIFSQYYVIDPPKNILLLDRPAVAFRGQNLQFYKGLQPKWRNDVIILSPSANDVTVLHETLHAQFGVGELIAYPGGQLLGAKNRVRKLLKKLGFSKRKTVREVKYSVCSGCDLCQNMAGKLKVYMPDGAKPKHFRLEYVSE